MASQFVVSNHEENLELGNGLLKVQVLSLKYIIASGLSYSTIHCLERT